MYRIIGKDGQQYGPVTAEQLRSWIAENRANAQTLVQADGAQDWKPLGSFSEFAADLKPPPVTATVRTIVSRISTASWASWTSSRPRRSAGPWIVGRIDTKGRLLGWPARTPGLVAVTTGWLDV